MITTIKEHHALFIDHVPRGSNADVKEDVNNHDDDVNNDHVQYHCNNNVHNVNNDDVHRHRR